MFGNEVFNNFSTSEHKNSVNVFSVYHLLHVTY